VGYMAGDPQVAYSHAPAMFIIMFTAFKSVLVERTLNMFLVDGEGDTMN
jgi:hypothetical protein